MRKAWIVARDSYGDRIVYAVATSEAKARELAFAFDAEVDDSEIDLYEDEDPVPEHVVLYDYDWSCYRAGEKGLLTTHAVLAVDYAPTEEAHYPQVSAWVGWARAENYRSAEEAIAAVQHALEALRDWKEVE